MRRSLIGLLAALVAAFLCAQARAGTYFIVQCGYSHQNFADVIKQLPDGSSHSHTYVGNMTTDSDPSYTAALTAGTSCGEAFDTAGYWQPSPILNGVIQQPLYARIYYGCGVAPCSAIKVPPANAMLVTTGALNTTVSQASLRYQKFDCGQNTPVAVYPYDCSAYYAAHPTLHDSSNDGVVAWGVFPQWWDGNPGSLADYGGALFGVGWTTQSEFSYTKTGAYTTPIPLITVRYHLGKAWDSCLPTYPQATPPASTCLSFGTPVTDELEYWQLHADFWNTWNQPALATEVQNCLVTQPNNCPHFFGTH